ncbi:MAG: hypothetical protein K9G46_01040 [Flavobacteriales bacterium]|jgi:hypothetical protein|nr:hypothetical protein [Flavobacteriales bacterium]
MANGNRRIPRADKELDSYIRTTTNALLEFGPPDGWERLGLSEAQKDQWKALRDEWVVAYARTVDGRSGTSVAVKNKNDVRKRFTVFTYPLLVWLQVQKHVTIADRAVFNIPIRKKTVTKRSDMHDAPQTKLQNMEGGWIKLRVRLQDSEGRGRIHPQADHMEFRYALLPLGANPPATAMECRNLDLTTRALSVLKLPDTALGMVIYLFCRWVNSSDNKKSGPWSNRVQAIVS